MMESSAKPSDESSRSNRNISSLVSPSSEQEPQDGNKDKKAESAVSFSSTKEEFITSPISTPAPPRTMLRLSKKTTLKVPTGILRQQRHFIGKIINDPKVDNVMLFLIFISSISISLSTFTTMQQYKDFLHAVGIADTVFLSIFTVESSMQLFYHGVWGELGIIHETEKLFDLVVVIVSWSFASFQIFRSLRMFRLLGKIETVKTLLSAIITATPTIGAIFSLLVLVMYIFAVMFTMLFKELDVNSGLEETSGYFSRLDHTFFTLVQFMTMDWSKSCYEVREHFSWAPLLYIFYQAISSFIILNLIIAVLCAVLETWEEDKEEKEENAQRMTQLNKLSKEINVLKRDMAKTNTLLVNALEEIATLKGNKKRGLFDIR